MILAKVKIKLIFFVSTFFLALIVYFLIHAFGSIVFSSEAEQVITFREAAWGQEKLSTFTLFCATKSSNPEIAAYATICMAQKDDWKGKYYEIIINKLKMIDRSPSSEAFVYMGEFSELKISPGDKVILRECFRRNLESENDLVVEMSFFTLYFSLNDSLFLNEFVQNSAISEDKKMRLKELFNRCIR